MQFHFPNMVSTTSPPNNAHNRFSVFVLEGLPNAYTPVWSNLRNITLACHGISVVQWSGATTYMVTKRIITVVTILVSIFCALQKSYERLSNKHFVLPCITEQYMDNEPYFRLHMNYKNSKPPKRYSKDRRCFKTTACILRRGFQVIHNIIISRNMHLEW